MKIQPNTPDRPPLDTRTVSIMNPYDTTAVRNFVTTNFPGSVLLEEHQVSGYSVSGPRGGNFQTTVHVFCFQML